MPQIFAPGANAVARLVLIGLLVVPVSAVLAGYWVEGSGMVTGQDYTPHQVPPFSHEHHVGGLGIGCRYCHTGVEKAAFAGLPPTHTCMTCHSQIWTNAPMLAPVRASLAQNKPLVWQRVHNLPDYVYFDHSIHVAKGVGCSSCHGPVDTMPLIRQAAPLTMGWCLTCHEHPERFIRPKEAIYDMHWSPPADQEEQGRKLLADYLIEKEHLIDCSVCHR